MNQSPNRSFWRTLLSHKKLVFLLIFLGIIVCAGVATLNYYKNSRIITITYDDTISSVALWKVEKGSTLIKNIDASSSQQRLTINNTYELRYKGASGYANATVSFKPTTDKISLTADYSQEKYATMFAEDRATFNQMISAIDSSVSSLYTINDGTYYDKGRWYVTTLTSTQEPAQYFDTFMVVLGKTDGKWSVVVSPTLVANYKQYASIPKDVINFANMYRQKEVLKEIAARSVY